jgi:hypothetical protein
MLNKGSTTRFKVVFCFLVALVQSTSFDHVHTPDYPLDVYFEELGRPINIVVGGLGIGSH